MKQKELKAAVKSYVAEVGAENVDRQKLSIELMEQGASVALLGRALNKALKENGVEIQTNVVSDEVIALRKDVKSIPADNYTDFRAYCVKLADKHDVPVDRAVKEIRKIAKENDIEVPSKPKLGAVKAAIVDYFNEETDHSLDGLAAYLEPVMDGNKEKALHASRMNYTFAALLYNHEALPVNGDEEEAEA